MTVFSGGKRRILLFDMELGGHRTDYIQYLIEYWRKKKLEGTLYIVVPPPFIENYPEVVDLAQQYEPLSIQFVPVSHNEYRKLFSKRLQVQKVFAEWRLLNKYVSQLQATHGLLMHFDFFQLPIVLQMKTSCLISGIYFRPTLHYHTFSKFVPTFKDTLRAWRHRIFLKGVLRNSSLLKLFSLDLFAVQYIRQLYRTDKIIELPDPVKIHPTAAERGVQLRQQLDIEEGRKVLLLFGALAKRKGIYQLFEALKLLPQEICRQICLVMVGEIRDTNQEVFDTRVIELEQNLPIQIIRRHEFVLEQDIQPYFCAADIILALYQQHTGMSGIINRAAIAGRPVLTSNYGLVGELVQQYNLGVAIDSTMPSEIAQGLTTCIRHTNEQLFDIESTQQFAQSHSPEQFAQVIFDNLV